jgi:hypothetical protein
MKSTYSQTRVSGALLILVLCSIVGIIGSIVYSGHLAIIFGVGVVTLAVLTRMPETKRDRAIVFSMAGISILLGIGAISLGIVTRILANVVQAG